jgi:feruloyl esterase
MRTALERGYATASTDTGHTGNTASFAPGHPEKVVDFGWRAAHEMTMAAKRIVTAHYERAPRYSYWNGCSAGGRQAMQEAQRFPADFDGIIAGAPGLDWTGRAGQALRVAKALETSEPARLPQAARVPLHEAAVRACDASDGVKDGLIGDPERCRFDPAVLQCASASATDCLSPAQVETARLIYSSATNPKTGREVAGLLPGSELGWTDLGWTASARATGLDQFRFIVFGDPAWTVARFDVDADIARADSVDGGTINALDPDLKPFFDRGGKLIQYHGWSDPQISPSSSTRYYRRVLEALAGKRTCRRPTACSWRPAWATVAAAKDRTRSTCSRPSNAGSNSGRRRTRFPPRTRPMAASIERARCVHFRVWPSTRAAEARTRPPTSSAPIGDMNQANPGACS